MYEYSTIRKEESSPAATHVQIEALYGTFGSRAESSNNPQHGY